MNPNDLDPSDAESTALARWVKWVNWTPKIAAGMLLLLVSAYGIAFWQNGWSKSPDAWGQLGDYVGGLLNPLVAGFALMALVVSVRLQKAELAATRKELEISRLAMQDQATTAEQQRQEQRFFDLFSIYHRTIDSVRISVVGKLDHSETHHQGKDALDAWFRRRLPRELHTFDRHGLGAEHGSAARGSRTIDKELLEGAWKVDSSSGSFDHYLRVIYRLLVDSESLLGEQHFRYVKILRAQLNRNELILLGFNMWLSDEGKKMIPFAEKYGLLKHLKTGKLRSQLEKELPSGIFGRTHSISNRITESSE